MIDKKLNPQYNHKGLFFPHFTNMLHKQKPKIGYVHEKETSLYVGLYATCGYGRLFV